MNLDSIKTAGVKMALNQYLEDMAEITDLDIDPEVKRVSMNAYLKGELTKTWLEMDYHLEPDALVLDTFRCERVWIENALKKYAAGKRVPLKNDMVEKVVRQLL